MYLLLSYYHFDNMSSVFLKFYKKRIYTIFVAHTLKKFKFCIFGSIVFSVVDIRAYQIFLQKKVDAR